MPLKAFSSAGISPKREAGKTSKKRFKVLTNSIKNVLTDAINNGGTTLNDFSNVDGNPGYFSQVLNVYGRENMPCMRCNGKIKTNYSKSTCYLLLPQMSTLDNPKALFQSSCSTNSEPYALQNIGDMMCPEFSENCIIIVDPQCQFIMKHMLLLTLMMSYIFANILKEWKEILKMSKLRIY
jgi:ubiquitin C-terminal hydrolase